MSLLLFKRKKIIGLYLPRIIICLALIYFAISVLIAQDSTNLPKGFQKKVYLDGVYMGILKNGLREEKGIFTFNLNNSMGLLKYLGQWKKDKKEGIGTMLFRNKDRYTGQWINDKRVGKGAILLANGTLEFISIRNIILTCEIIWLMNRLN